jgi:hypothetical protein
MVAAHDADESSVPGPTVKTRPGRRGALLRLAPLRTVHATRRGTGSSKPEEESAPSSPYAVLTSSRPRPRFRSPPWVSNLSLGSGRHRHFVVKAHPPHVSPLSRPGTRPGIRPVIRRASGWRTGPASCAFLLPFSRRHWLLGRPVPAKDLGLPYGRLTTAPQERRGPGRGFHVPHA